jgi:hypothetical protein
MVLVADRGEYLLDSLIGLNGRRGERDFFLIVAFRLGKRRTGPDGQPLRRRREGNVATSHHDLITR